MKTDKIRETYLDFFKSKGHSIVPSDSLVPQNDPTLLFTGAGMNQFKDYFLGLKKDLKRAASSQKCLRTGDLEEVGRTAFHHSFFEMLGNFSFGDYFKKEAIEWAWEFLTVKLQIPKERLRVSVHKEDSEAYEIWSKIVRKDWIYKLGDKDNFWPSNAPKNGPNGPCGPCSEIYFDLDSSGGDGGTVEDKRFAEIWNLVFTQFDRQEGGKLVPLAQKNIDTGMGLERLACVLQDKKTNYEIDIFQPINEKIASLLVKNLVKKAGEPLAEESKKSRLYAISDHLRAIAFSITDGVIPSNEGRGYVIRKLIRRALWHAYELTTGESDKPFLYQALPAVVKVMSHAYPELEESQQSISGTILGEEERFLATLENGLNILNDRIPKLKGGMIPGELVFELYDTYGFPDELTRKIAFEKGLEIDQPGFDRLMEEQRKRAKAATQISGEIFVTTDLEKKLAGLPATTFLGYQALHAQAKVLLTEIKNQRGVLVIDQSPFYAESGGQVGDQGILKGKNFEAKVADVQKKDIYFIHHIEILSGAVKTGDAVECSVDVLRRARIMRNHTATHLLHAALRNILGAQVRQLGSLVAPDRLRFDYSYSQAITAEQIRQIEDSVNSEILKDTALSKEEKDTEQAKKEGALAFFGEKYGNRVRVVTVPGFSKEFCGGTHCDRTGQIGAFVITSDSSIGSGTRRIEALTGEGALDYVRTLRNQVQQIAQNLKTTPDQLVERIAKLQDNLKKLEKEKGSGKLQAIDSTKILSGAKMIGPVRLAIYTSKGMDVNELRHLSDDLRSRSPKTVYFLAAEQDEKIQFLLGMSPDLKKTSLNMTELGTSVGALIEANAGGRVDLVQGGAPNKGQLYQKKEALEAKISDYIQDKIHELKN
ncbi:MAG: alanine--tRNA ligase [Candidatus Omnitrophica bacterium]|nr:alanine--tRNA ligase [Candidatus Omnitrophota bacterium]